MNFIIYGLYIVRFSLILFVDSFIYCTELYALASNEVKYFHNVNVIVSAIAQ